MVRNTGAMEMGKLLLCKERQAQYFPWCGKCCHGNGETQSTQGNVCHGEGQRSPGRPHSFPCLGIWVFGTASWRRSHTSRSHLLKTLHIIREREDVPKNIKMFYLHVYSALCSFFSPLLIIFMAERFNLPPKAAWFLTHTR